MIQIGETKAVKIITFLLVTWLVVPLCFGANVTVDKYKGLQRNPAADKIEDGAFTKLDNAFIQDGNLRVVRGRDKMNTTAHTDTTVNGMFYYERPSNIVDPTALWHCDSPPGILVDAVGIYNLTQGTSACSGNSTIKKYGDSSIDCTGAADYVYAADSDTWVFSNDATVEFYVYFDTVGADQVLWSQQADASNFLELALDENGATDRLTFEVEVGGVTTMQMFWNWTPAATTWYHIAFVKDGNDYEIFVDGVSLGTQTDTDTYPNIDSQLLWGFGRTLGGGTNALFCDCKFDEMRIDNDEALYTANFTALTAPFDLEYDTTVQKLVVAESDDIVVYDTDGTNRTVIAQGLTDKSWDFMQVGNKLYALNTDDGQYAWMGVDGSMMTINANTPKFNYMEEYKGFVFACENRDLRFSNAIGSLVSDDETWSESDHYLIGFNQYTCTGLAKTANGLAIFSPNSVQEVYGDDASTFQIRNIVNGVGTPADATIVSDEHGDLIWFGGVQGVFKLITGRSNLTDSSGVRVNRGDYAVLNISEELSTVFQGTDNQIVLDPDDYDTANAYYDITNNLYWLFIDTHAFVYDNANDAWFHIPGIVTKSSIFAYSTSELNGKAYLLDDQGFFYENWTGFENGVASGTVTGHPTAGTSNTLTDSTATFYTTGSGLAGAWVILDTGSGLEYQQIASNTGTQLTIVNTFATTPTTAHTYYVGYIMVDVLTKQYALAKPPGITLVQAIDLMHNKSDAAQNVTLSWYSDKSETADGTDVHDFQTNYWDRSTMHSRGFWIQLGMRTNVYNTSNDISDPFDLISYGFKAIGKDAD